MNREGKNKIKKTMGTIEQIRKNTLIRKIKEILKDYDSVIEVSVFRNINITYKFFFFRKVRYGNLVASIYIDNNIYVSDLLIGNKKIEEVLCGLIVYDEDMIEIHIQYTN